MSFEHKPENRNLYENFRAHPNGFADFGAWVDHHREMHKRHSLECAEFGGEWLRKWDALLDAPALLQEYPGGCAFYGPPLRFSTLRKALDDMRIRVSAPNQRRVRVTFLDGTVVKEWSACGT